MKVTFLVILLYLMSIGNMFAQSGNSDQNVAIITQLSSSDTYIFNHEMQYFEAFEKRLFSELNSDEEEIVNSLSLKNSLCKVKFNSSVSKDVREEKLALITKKMNFSDFRIE